MNKSLSLRFAMFLLLVMACVPIVEAYNFEYNGVYYNITSSTNMTVEVTYYNKSNNTYSGVVTIPNIVSYNGKNYTVTAIGDYAFVGCTNFLGLNITAKNLTSIGSYVFSGCNGMTEFTVNKKIKSIGNYSFNGCYSLSEISFESTTTSISLGYGSSQGQAHGLFEDCPLEHVTIDRPLSYNTNSNYGYSPFARQEDLSIIELGQNITSIPSNLFWGNTAITSYTVPSHITSLDDWAFCNFLGARSITLNQNTEYISYGAFNGCRNLTSINIPSKVTDIGAEAFAYSGIKSIVIPPSVTSIGNYAFNGCTALTQVTIEESEEPLSLGYNYCYNIYEDYSNHPGRGLFYDCPLNSVFIGRMLSYGTQFRFGYSPFANNETLVKARLGNPVTSIQANLFRGCKSFKTINYNSNCKPTFVDSYAFAGCKSIVNGSNIIPSSVKTFGENVFRDSYNLENITIPSKVTLIGQNSFSGCTKLSNVVSLATTPPSINANCFDTDTYQTATLSVNTAAISAYSDATGWKNFSHIVGGGQSGTIVGDVNGDGNITAGDVTELYNCLLNNDQTYITTCDVNGDGEVTAADITALYDILLGN